MLKWVILATGVFLFANGMSARTDSFENEDPARHCFWMDWIGLDGCFGNAMAPTLVTWGATLIGAAAIGWSIIRSRRPKPLT